MLDTIIKEYPEFFRKYEKLYIERFIYNSTEIEGIKTPEERKIFVEQMLKAFYSIYHNDGAKIAVTDILNLSNLINEEYGLNGFRRTLVYPGDYASFKPCEPSKIYYALYILLDNYYNIWSDEHISPYLREAMFHINFMRIHPFEDGNKRTGKIIMASNLLKAKCAPVIITEDDTEVYYSFINNMDYEGFAEFLKNRSKIEMDTLVGWFKMENDISMYESPEDFVRRRKNQ